MISEKLKEFKSEIQSELRSILNFWVDHAVDETNGGFVGRINQEGIVHHDAEKGCVLNARILWTFSAASHNLRDPDYYALAERAYLFLKDYFLDKKNGGVYWSVYADGSPRNTRKQIYGLAFTVYGLSEFYRISQKQEVLDLAIDIFDKIERYSFDHDLDGYLEAFDQNWEPLRDYRLSEKDRNDPKTMNTHLHIIEAYVNLYRVWPEPKLADRIKNLLHIFEKYVIDPSSFHLKLFFDRQWTSQSKAISFGHDIEASWLLLDAALSLNEEQLSERWQKISVRIAEAATRGLMQDGSFIHEYDPSTHRADTHREWWVSAEGMVGFLNAYQLTGETAYLEKVFGLWKFVQQHLLDRKNGEWFWGVYEDYSKMTDDKIGFWKCPYHNVRACLEIMNRN